MQVAEEFQEMPQEEAAPESGTRPRLTEEEKAEQAAEDHQQEEEKSHIDEMRAIFTSLMLQEDIDIDPKELQELQEALPFLFTESSPEFEEFIEKINPEINKMVEEVDALRAKGETLKAVEKVGEFLKSTEAEISGMPDSKLKEEILAYIGMALKVSEMEADMNAQLKLELMSVGVDLIPVVGSGKMIYEAARGRTMSGEVLSKSGRLLHAGEATLFLALDGVSIAGLFLGGVPTAAAQGSKAAVVGLKGMEAGRVLTRFAALIRKTTKSRKAAKTIFKVGMLMRKYPKLAQVMMKTAKIARNKNLLKAGQLAKYQKDRKAMYEASRIYKYSKAGEGKNVKLPSQKESVETDLAEAA